MALGLFYRSVELAVTASLAMTALVAARAVVLVRACPHRSGVGFLLLASVVSLVVSVVIVHTAGWADIVTFTVPVGLVAAVTAVDRARLGASTKTPPPR